MSTPNEHDSPWIVETTAQQFEQDVFERSKSVPVVVDFWATWCQPCRLLAPALESLARQYAGKFTLVKANVDALPEAAAEFQVQSIPSVFGLVDGQVVDFFQGVMSPERITAWLTRLLAAGRLLDAKALETQDPARAEQLYRAIHAARPNAADAAIGLARLLVGQDRIDAVRQLIATLEQRGFLEPELEKIKASLALRSVGEADLAALRAAVQSAPGDARRKLDLVQALAARAQYQEALELALAALEQDKAGAGEDARQLMVDIFRVLPEDSELTQEYRRQLARLLY